MPSENFWSDVEKLCRANDILLILDDVRTGWRLHKGGSHKYFNFTPDLAVYSRAWKWLCNFSMCRKKIFLDVSKEVF